MRTTDIAVRKKIHFPLKLAGLFFLFMPAAMFIDQTVFVKSPPGQPIAAEIGAAVGEAAPSDESPQGTALPSAGGSGRPDSPKTNGIPPVHAQPVPSQGATPAAKPALPRKPAKAKPTDARPVKASARAVENKWIALTFDDGPDGKYTPQVLDILKENQIKATFFVVGIQAKKYPEVLKRIAEEGHAIGNHSWDHKDLAKLSAKQVRDEIAKNDNLIREITGRPADLFRPPYGSENETVRREISAAGHRHVLWSVDPRDWDKHRSAEQIANAVKNNTKPGSIVLMHSFGGNLGSSVKALPLIIASLKEKGYTFVTVPELIGK